MKCGLVASRLTKKPHQISYDSGTRRAVDSGTGEDSGRGRPVGAEADPDRGTQGFDSDARTERRGQGEGSAGGIG